ncbi:lipoate--protein ligase family protein [Pyrococcus abyssi]|uniref:Lipoate-protein ligase a related n=1 Tax=Pyrococcus abyssi (strain GE5 / Orsay) TaxID=272844 RepID=Q9V0V8_PYRAB|nr:biotin/lipoate A/B protein ligase family protein [Pyrococcus abyssi]CAB49595.1 lplA-like lipoate-protein ligase A related [Pyrococcus abyssi GE5]CCE70071.1 TPA: lipoate-protein ligase a related [Pyrococcus abyssi GE5]
MRFIPLIVARPELQMAIDEAILIARSEGKVPDTVRLYVFKPSSVTIGRFQSVRHDVDIEKARELNIPVVRRITGGGSVFHDEFGEITYSVVISDDYHPSLKNIQESYRFLAGPLVDALKDLGLNAGFSGLNDIVVNGKKISGSAQTRRKGIILQHGTFMYSTRLEVLASVLKVSKEKLRDKGIRSIYERVTTLEREGIKLSMQETYELLRNSFFRAFPLEEGELTEYELELAQELVEERYGKDEWNFMK